MKCPCANPVGSLVLGWVWLGTAAVAQTPAILPVSAQGHDSRVDLVWSTPEAGQPAGYVVERALESRGPFSRLHAGLHEPAVYSDFLGTNGRTHFYRVTARDRDHSVIAASDVVSACPRAMADDELLTSVQEATFRYFWHYAHPASGLARDRKGSRHTVTSGGSGFGLMAIVVGVERGFVTRQAAANRVLKTLRFLEEKAVRHHGAWPHWLHGESGQTIPFSRDDDGGDLVETSFLIQGILTVRQFFQATDPVEAEIRVRATRVWETVEWDWYLKDPAGTRLFWHWSPRHGWTLNHPIGGHFNECLITYLLAIASPTHGIGADCYSKGWAGDPPVGYVNGTNYYGYKLWVGGPFGGPLFFTHYSFLGFDPRNKRDRYCDYFENNRNFSLIHQAYCRDNPAGHKGYNALVWGLTASDTPGGYHAHEPLHDNGTISPTAALSAMPYVPRESLATLKHLYHTLGPRLWGEFGFKDAFNLDRDWFADSYLAIDQGPIVVMIENHRTGLCWRLFMSNPEIPRVLKATGWEVTGAGPDSP